MDLILWRHAEAEDGVPDLARRLTAKGHGQAEKMGAWLKERLPEDVLVLCSPAERCQQTASALTKDFTTLKELAPGASHEILLNAAQWPRRNGSVVLVSHQPTLGELAAFLLCGEASGWNVKKGAIYWLRRRDNESQAFLRAALSPEMV
ncbi:MAG: histidine phosphatase family protein [Betaproteobacteria bacterium]|nr:histidine phosphatase family protein [Betaproteobacteria bacterium]